MKVLTTIGCIACATFVPGFALSQEQPGRDACINQLRAKGGPDAAKGIEVLSTDWSQAGTLVTMRDAGGTVWTCIGYEDGGTADLRVAEAADDGEGAMAGNDASEGPEGGGETSTQVVKFEPGTSGATYQGTLTPGSTIRYVLGARKDQFLDVNIRHKGGKMSYQIWNPDRTFLLEMIAARKPYRGQLWQSGDHVVELINRGQQDEVYGVEFVIE